MNIEFKLGLISKSFLREMPAGRAYHIFVTGQPQAHEYTNLTGESPARHNIQL